MDIEQLGAFKEFFANGGSLRMLKDIPKEQLEQLYHYGQQQLQQGHLQQAHNIFYLLVYCDHWNHEFLLALGLTYQQRAEHEDAINSFSQAAQCKVIDPRAPYLAAQSYQAQQRWPLVEKALTSASMLCHNLPQWKELRLEVERQLVFCRTELRRSTQHKDHQGKKKPEENKGKKGKIANDSKKQEVAINATE